MPATTVDDEIKNKLLDNPKRILSIARNMGADVGEAEKLYFELMRESSRTREWFDKLEAMLDSAVRAIIGALRTEFRRQGLGEFDVEKHFQRAMMDLKRCTPESIRRAQESIKRAKSEAKRLDMIKKETLEAVMEIEGMLKNTKALGKAWSTRNEYLQIEGSIEEIFEVLDRGSYELARHLAKSSLVKAKEFRDMKSTALRYAAKAGHIVGKLKAENSSPEAKNTFRKLNTYLNSVKFLLENGDYKTALILAGEAKHEAEKLLPSDKTGICTFVCPICFDIQCPNSYCNTSISPSPLIADTCRTYCTCGIFYHICCIQKGQNITCVNCYRPMKG